jgi:hypothetical protein
MGDLIDIPNTEHPNPNRNSEDEIDTSWIENYDKEDDQYKMFYKEPNKELRLSVLYINPNNDLENIKTKRIQLIEPNQITREEFIYIIKNHDRVAGIKYKLINILLYNIDIESDNMQHIINSFNSGTKNNFFNNLVSLDTYTFNSTIRILQEINTLYIILKEDVNLDKYNHTKRIHFNISSNEEKQKAKRKTKRRR